MWVLLEQVQTEQQKKQIYFKGWAGYQPVTTEDLREAFTFDEKRDAKLSAAYRHKQSSFVPIEVDVVVKSKAA